MKVELDAKGNKEHPENIVVDNGVPDLMIELFGARSDFVTNLCQLTECQNREKIQSMNLSFRSPKHILRFNR